MVKLGLVTPVLSTTPTMADWERGAGIDEVALIAATADELGFDYLHCAEHIAFPAPLVEVVGGARSYDPLATFGYLAACTEHIGFLTYVLVLGYHHPWAIAKRYGTLDAVSKGRVTLGVGVGPEHLRDLFERLGADFDGRGSAADRALVELRRVLDEGVSDGYVFEPRPARRVPILVGGFSRRALRRALALGDGWCPGPFEPGELRATLASVEVPPGFEVVIPIDHIRVPPSVDPLREPAQVVDRVAALSDAGATALMVRVPHASLEEYLDQLRALRELVPAPFRAPRPWIVDDDMGSGPASASTFDGQVAP
jgi:alkanesulfonate monooxygenase SsuD/methylene tetrahydromethanopterin reductase-like flavin-dependent oxidoreductase (luciferase family)